MGKNMKILKYGTMLSLVFLVIAIGLVQIYAADDIVFKYSRTSTSFGENLFEGLDLEDDFDKAYGDDSVWAYGNMDYARNKNSLDNTNGWYIVSSTMEGRSTSRSKYVNVSSISELVDAGEVFVSARVDTGNNASFIVTGKDSMKMKISFCDHLKRVKSTKEVTSSPNYKMWDVNSRINYFKVPKGTRYILYEIYAFDDNDHSMFAMFANPKLYLYDLNSPMVKSVNMVLSDSKTILTEDDKSVRRIIPGSNYKFEVGFSEPVKIDSNAWLGLNMKFKDPNSDYEINLKGAFRQEEENIKDNYKKYIFYGEFPSATDKMKQADYMELSLIDIRRHDSGDEANDNIKDYSGRKVYDLDFLDGEDDITISGTPIIVDAKKPTINSITSKSGNGIFSVGDSVVFELVFSESVVADSDHKFLLNNGAYATYYSGSNTKTLLYKYVVKSNNVSIENLKIVSYEGMANDRASNALDASLPAQTFKVDVDTIGPTIKFTNNDGSIYIDESVYKKEHEIYISVEDDISGVGDISYYIDTNENVENFDDAKQIANGTVPIVNPEKANGENYYLHAKAIDIAGNETIETKGPIYFDNENPQISINPMEGENRKEYDVEVLASDKKSGILDIEYTWYLVDDEGSSEISSGSVQNGNSIKSPDMDGEYKVLIEAKDKASNKSTLESLIFKIDKTLPNAVFSSQGNIEMEKVASVDVTITDDEYLDKGYYQWTKSVIQPSVDDENWSLYYTSVDKTLSYNSIVLSGNDKNGIWYLHVKCIDKTGNVGIYTTQDGFNLDNEKIDAVFTRNGNIEPENDFQTILQVNNESSDFLVMYEITTKDTSKYIDEEMTEYNIDGGDIVFNVNKDTVENITDTYYIHVKIIDSANNVSYLSSNPIYIDNNAPTGSISVNTNYTNNDNVLLNFDVDDINPANQNQELSMNLSYDGGLTFEGWIPYSNTKSLILEKEQEYAIVVKYKDVANNVSENYNCSVIYDITAPEIESINYDSSYTNKDLLVTLKFGDVTLSDDMDIIIDEDKTTANVSIENKVATFKENGDLVFVFKDLAGNENSQVITITNIDKEAPLILIEPDGDESYNKSAVALISATDNVTDDDNIELYYSFSKSSSVEPEDYLEASEAVSKSEENGKWYLWVKAIDELGNTSVATSKAFNLDNIDPYALDVEYSPPDITANNVVASVLFDNEVKIISPVKTLEYSNSYDYTFLDNENITITFIDLAGNEGSLDLEVDWIDRDLPSATQEYSTKDFTNEPVTVTVSTNDAAFSLYDFVAYIDDERVFIEASNDEANLNECVYNWNNDNLKYRLDGDFDVINYDSSIKLLEVIVDNGGIVSGAKFEIFKNAHIDYRIIRTDTNVSGSGMISVDKIDLVKPTASLKYSSKEEVWVDLLDEKWTNQDVIVTIDTNDNSNKDVTIVNNDGEDTYTFTENGSFEFVFVDSASNENKVKASVSKIDKIKPTATIEYYTKDISWTDLEDEKWTNEEVIAKITLSDNSNTDVKILNNDGDDTYTFNENGSYIFEICDEAGNINEIKATVSKIDKEIKTPTIKYSTQEWTNEDVIVSISFDDSQNVDILNNNKESSYTFKTNSEFTFEYQDEAGNIGSTKVSVNNIDKVNPTVSQIWYSATEPTNGKVVSKVYADEYVEFITDNGADTYTFIENGEHEFVFMDRAGNRGSIKGIVNNIDKIAPDAFIEYSTTELTNKSVIATIKSNEDIKIINNLNRNQYVFYENGEFTFVYEDLAGNRDEITAKVSNIDNTNPIITLEYSETDVTNEDVIVTIVSDKDIYPVNYSGNTVSFSKNGSRWLEVTDVFGEVLYFEVEVSNIDKEAPIIQFGNGQNLIIPIGSEFNPLEDVMAIDNFDDQIQNKIEYVGEVDTSKEGVYTITYSCMDVAGNSISEERKVHVFDSLEFMTYINSEIANEDEVLTRGTNIKIDVFGTYGEYSIKWLSGKHKKGDFKECEQYVQFESIEIDESGYYTFLIQDQERQTKLLSVYIIHTR